MEDNVADALKMAGFVLIFVLGLSIVFIAYSNARQSIDAVLSYSDRESLTIDNNSRYYYLLDTSKASRNVGIETVIPTIYRAYKENYKIIFDFSNIDSSYYLFKNKAGDEIKKIDLEELSIATDLESRIFLNGILYGDFETNNNDFKEHFKLGEVNEKIDSLYYHVLSKNYKIEEKLGTYYMEDLDSVKSQNPEANKTEKRVITYTFTN